MNKNKQYCDCGYAPDIYNICSGCGLEKPRTRMHSLNYKSNFFKVKSIDNIIIFFESNGLKLRLPDGEEKDNCFSFHKNSLIGFAGFGKFYKDLEEKLIKNHLQDGEELKIYKIK